MERFYLPDRISEENVKFMPGASTLPDIQLGCQRISHASSMDFFVLTF
jgi:hypothetical protein